MLINYQSIENIYLVCGKTDMRLGIDGLALIVQDKFELNLYQNALFLFCGRRTDRFKALYWDGNGFFLLYKRIENGSLHWPRHAHEAQLISQQQLRWLLEGLRINQKRAIPPRSKHLTF